MQIYAASYLLPISGSPVEGGAVAVENGLIKAVGRLADLRSRFAAAAVHEFPGAVLMPGLVNAHTHLELTHFPAWLAKSAHGSDACSYVDWIIRVIKVKSGLTLDELVASLLAGLKISLQSGTTMVGDILSERRLIPLYKKSLLSGRLYLEFIGQDPARYSERLLSIHEDLRSLPDNFLPGLSPHAPFTVSAPLLHALLDVASDTHFPLTMHLAESAEESAFFFNSSGRIATELYPFVGWDRYLPEPLGISPTEWLDSERALSPDLLAVHAVHLNQADIDVVKGTGTSVVLVPRSNYNLGVGKAPVQLLLEAGVPLALGTDSLASSDSLSLWDEMRFLLDEFPGVFTAKDALRLATIGGAQALKRDSEAGTLEPGKRADFIVVQTGSSPDKQRLYQQLLEGAKILAVWSGGKRT